MLDFPHIAATVRAERARRDWTQTELASKIGRHVNTVIKAEDGKPVSRNTVQRLARALDISVQSLLKARAARSAA